MELTRTRCAEYNRDRVEETLETRADFYAVNEMCLRILVNRQHMHSSNLGGERTNHSGMSRFPSPKDRAAARMNLSRRCHSIVERTRMPETITEANRNLVTPPSRNNLHYQNTLRMSSTLVGHTTGLGTRNKPNLISVAEDSKFE
jgi:hypothetical protein